MPRRAILHIGHPKTATTFLQHLMQLNSAALGGAGFSIPCDYRAVGGHDFGHLANIGAVYSGNAAPFFFALEGGRPLDRLDTYLDGGSHLLLSSELLFYRPAFVEQFASRLVARDCRVEVIAYVDRYDRAAVKAYCQNIRNHAFAGTLVEFLEQTAGQRLLRYHEVHARLRACDAIAEVEFRAFPSEYLNGGCIERDFFERLSPDLDVAAFIRPRDGVNSTLSLAELEAVRRLNAEGNTAAVQRVIARERHVDDLERKRIRRCYFSQEAKEFLLRELSSDRDRFAALMPPEQVDLWRLDTLVVDSIEPDPVAVQQVLASVGRVTATRPPTLRRG